VEAAVATTLRGQTAQAGRVPRAALDTQQEAVAVEEEARLMLGTMLLVGGLVVLATVEEAFQSTALLMVVAEVEVDTELAHALRVVAQMAAAMVPIRI
jgi:hypothetical protein